MDMVAGLRRSFRTVRIALMRLQREAEKVEPWLQMMLAMY